MKELILDIEKLREPSSPLTFIDSDGMHTEEIDEIINYLQEVFDANSKLVALAAPQIGINKRIFGLRFENEIKYFINPIITKKDGLIIAPEYFSSLPKKEILIGRPKEIRAIYYTKDKKYEDNKFLDSAARLFDQMAQVLDGIIPSDLGLVADIEEDGSFFDLSDEDMQKAIDIWKKVVATRLQTLTDSINEDENLKKVYKQLSFSEDVINGRTQVFEESNVVSAEQQNLMKQANRKAQMANFVRSKKSKSKGRK